MISHASKASFLHGDIINADISGSPGILRKEFPGAFQDTWEETVKNIYYPKVMAV